MSSVRMHPHKAIEVLGWYVVTCLDRVLNRAALNQLASLGEAAVGKPRKRKAFEGAFLRLLGRECPDVMKLIPVNRRARFTAGAWAAVKDGRLPRVVRRRRVSGRPGVSRPAIRPRRKLDVGYARDRRRLLARLRAGRRSP